MKYLLLLLFLAANLAFAASTDELLDQIKSVLAGKIKAGQNAGDPAGQRNSYRWQEMLSRLDGARGDDMPELIRTVEEIASGSDSDSLKALCDTLAMQLRSEQDQQEAPLAEEMQKGMTAALRAALAAHSGKDLDPSIAAVHQLLQKSPRNPKNPKLRALSIQGPQVLEFLLHWQNYVAGVDDRTGSADFRLRNLLDVPDFSALMPRSELLARLAEVLKEDSASHGPMPADQLDEKARAILSATKSLDDLSTAAEQFQLLFARSGSSPKAHEIWMISDALSQWTRIYADLGKGIAYYSDLGLLAREVPGANGAMAALHTQLMLFMARQKLGLPDTQRAIAGDDVPAYLQRIVSTALETSDWSLLERTLNFAEQAKIDTAFTAQDRTAVQTFLAGINQERARQYAFAVRSFQATLKFGVQIIPPELIGNHLDHIRQEHPKEFEEGARLVTAPL